MSVPNEDKYEKFVIVVNNGSGIIVLPKTEEYTYILTAKHILYEDKETMKKPIQNHIIKGKGLKVKFLKKYEHDTLDIAIIKIKKLDTETPLINFSALDNNQYDLFGYPAYNRNGEEYKLDNFKLTANKTKNDEKIIIFDEKDYSGQEVIEGVSGGGIFRELNNEIYLIAIEFEMNSKETKRRDRRIKTVLVKAFDEIVEKYSDELVEIYKEDGKIKSDNKPKEEKNIIAIFLVFFVVGFLVFLIVVGGERMFFFFSKKEEGIKNKTFYLKIKENCNSEYIKDDIGFFTNNKCTKQAEYLGNNPKNKNEHLLQIIPNKAFLTIYMKYNKYGCIKLLFDGEKSKHTFKCYKDCSSSENSKSIDCTESKIDKKEKGKCEEAFNNE